MQIIGGIFGFIFLMAFISSAAPAVGHAIETIFGLGVLAVAGFCLFHLARAGARAVHKGAELADYYLVRHPADSIVTAALRERQALDATALQAALTPAPSALALAKPLYHTKNQTENARALRQKLDADALLAQAAVRRERARAACQESERN